MLFLLAVSDEASRGFGWGYRYQVNGGDSRDFEATYLAKYLYNEYIEAVINPKATRFLRLPNSVCALVPRHVACVQPKANTPQVGCTVRALSHHLALLPGIGIAESEWLINGQWRPTANWQTEDDPGALRLLIVPFPYGIRGGDFGVTQHPERDGHGTTIDGEFTINQGWLKESGAGEEVSGEKLAQFVLSLIQVARTEASGIDVVIFPELALTDQVAGDLATAIAGHPQAPHMIIAGTSGDNGKQNHATVHLLAQGKLIESVSQSKHHRWKLDGNQIRSYNLGDQLNSQHRYWESIPVSERHLRFMVNRHNELIATLVCEDLARIDPVMPLLNAVGPNLVVALLMDGPQLLGRWPGRYATTLADDPGAAVLTVTSAGMVARSHGGNGPLPSHEARLSIALWRQPGQPARELFLPRDHHALLLCLSSHPDLQKTLDLREDLGIVLDLSAVRAIKAEYPPAWVSRPVPKP